MPALLGMDGGVGWATPVSCFLSRGADFPAKVFQLHRSHFSPPGTTAGGGGGGLLPPGLHVQPRLAPPQRMPFGVKGMNRTNAELVQQLVQRPGQRRQWRSGGGAHPPRLENDRAPHTPLSGQPGGGFETVGQPPATTGNPTNPRSLFSRIHQNWHTSCICGCHVVHLLVFPLCVGGPPVYLT